MRFLWPALWMLLLAGCGTPETPGENEAGAEQNATAPPPSMTDGPGTPLGTSTGTAPPGGQSTTPSTTSTATTSPSTTSGSSTTTMSSSTTSSTTATSTTSSSTTTSTTTSTTSTSTSSSSAPPPTPQNGAFTLDLLPITPSQTRTFDIAAGHPSLQVTVQSTSIQGSIAAELTAPDGSKQSAAGPTITWNAASPAAGTWSVRAVLTGLDAHVEGTWCAGACPA